MDHGYYLYNAVQRLLFEHHALFPDTAAYEEFMNGLANLLEI